MMRGSTPPSNSRPGGVRLNIDKVLVKQNRNSNQKQATQTRPGRDVQDAELQRVMEASKLVDGCLLRPREKVEAAAVEDAASSWARIDGLSPRMSTVGQAESLMANAQAPEPWQRGKFIRPQETLTQDPAARQQMFPELKRCRHSRARTNGRPACPPSRWARRRAAPWSRGRTRSGRCGVPNFTPDYAHHWPTAP